MKFLITNSAPDQLTIDIDGIIGENSPKGSNFTEFKEQLSSIDKSKNPKVCINIRSTGGDVNEALLIYDTIRELTDNEITTRCYGYVASAATIIAQGASEGKREISANALYLIHKSICSAEGNSNNHNQIVELLDKTDQRIASIYASRSGRPTDEFTQLMNQNNGDGIWLTPQEAKDAGLVDSIISCQEDTSNKNQNTMNISKHWQSIMNLLGIAQGTSHSPLDDNSLEMIENKLSQDKAEITNMQSKIITLEAENSRLNALATTTLQKEDPAAKHRTLTANQKAYGADIEKFK